MGLRSSKMVINTRVHTWLENFRAEGGTVGVTDQSTKVSSKTECEMVKEYGVLLEQMETFIRDNTKTT